MDRLDASLIEETLGIAALCAGCLVRMAGLSSWRLTDTLPRLIAALRVGSALGSCGACLKLTVVHQRQ